MELILFARSNCPLCEAMEDELRPYIQKYKIVVKRQYIDNNSDLEKSYGSKVPVLVFEGKVLCEYFLNENALLDEINVR